MAANFLYRKVYMQLKEEITEGKYAFGSLLPSENQLCKRFNVERSTVRKALSLLAEEGLIEKRPGVGCSALFKKTGDRDYSVSQESGFAVGFFVLENETSNKRITEPYYSDLFYYLEKECAANNLQLIYTTVSDSTDINGVIAKNNFKSVVFVTKAPRHLITEAKETGIPVLTVNDLREGIPCLTHDYCSGSFSAVNYLYKMGHREIALICGPLGFYATDAKLTGCYEAMIKNEIAIRKEWVVFGTDWTYQSGYAATKKLLEISETKPTAIFAFNDIMAVGAMQAIQEAGLRIPEDISVIGFDNMEQLEFAAPNLSTVDGNTAYLAHAIITTIVNGVLDGCNESVKIVVPTKLVERNSVKNLNL